MNKYEQYEQLVKNSLENSDEFSKEISDTISGDLIVSDISGFIRNLRNMISDKSEYRINYDIQIDGIAIVKKDDGYYAVPVARIDPEILHIEYLDHPCGRISGGFFYTLVDEYGMTTDKVFYWKGKEDKNFFSNFVEPGEEIIGIYDMISYPIVRSDDSWLLVS